MIIHIVIFQLIKKDVKDIEELKNELLILKKSPFVEEFFLIEKHNVLKSYIDGDLVLFSKFKSEKKLKSYMADKKHQNIIQKTSSNIQEKYILDFNNP